MESSHSTQFDIFDVYRSFCDIKSGEASIRGKEGYSLDDESERAKLTREALTRLLKFVESRFPSGLSIFDELMSSLNVLLLAIAAWKLVLSGRFQLLNQWCDFVELYGHSVLMLFFFYGDINLKKNHRYNISEDTWQQVLVFSRCAHESLEGYDPKGAWPGRIDDFVEHMYGFVLLPATSETSHI